MYSIESIVFACFLKLAPGVLVGHKMSFPQDGPGSLLSSEPPIDHGAEARSLPLLA